MILVVSVMVDIRYHKGKRDLSSRSREDFYFSMMASEEAKLITTSRDKSGGVFAAQHESQAEIIETHQKEKSVCDEKHQEMHY